MILLTQKTGSDFSQSGSITAQKIKLIKQLLPQSTYQFHLCFWPEFFRDGSI